MNAQEIKAAVDAGRTVHYVNEGSTVIKDRLGRYLIESSSGHCIGLTWLDGSTLNGGAHDFYVVGDLRQPCDTRKSVAGLLLCMCKA